MSPRYVIKKTGDVSVGELLAMLTRAHDELSALCHGKRWVMHVPVDADDSDMVIGDALRHAEAFVKATAEHCNLPVLPSGADPTEGP